MYYVLVLERGRGSDRGADCLGYTYAYHGLVEETLGPPRFSLKSCEVWWVESLVFHKVFPVFTVPESVVSI